MRALTGLGWISGLIDSDGFIVERLSEFLAVLLGRLFDLGVVRKLLTVCLCGFCPGRLV